MKRPALDDLRPHRRAQQIVVGLRERPHGPRCGRVHDAAHGRLGRREHRAHLLGVRHVDVDNRDVRSKPFELRGRTRYVRGFGLFRARYEKMVRTSLDQPSCNVQCGARQATGDEVRNLRRQRQRRCGCRSRCGHQPRDMPASAAKRDLVLGVRRHDLCDERLDVGRAALRIQIHEAAPRCRELLSRDAAQTPNGGLARVDGRFAIHRAGASRRDPQPRRLGGGAERLNHLQQRRRRVLRNLADLFRGCRLADDHRVQAA